jgi:hypothetical protein
VCVCVCVCVCSLVSCREEHSYKNMRTMYSGVLAGWKKTINKKLQNLYASLHTITIISRMIRWDACAGLIHWELHTNFLFKSQNGRQLGWHGQRWEDIVKMDLNPLPSNDIYICVTRHIYIHMSYHTANLRMLHFKYLANKYPYWIF